MTVSGPHVLYASPIKLAVALIRPRALRDHNVLLKKELLPLSTPLHAVVSIRRFTVSGSAQTGEIFERSFSTKCGTMIPPCSRTTGKGESCGMSALSSRCKQHPHEIGTGVKTLQKRAVELSLSQHTTLYPRHSLYTALSMSHGGSSVIEYGYVEISEEECSDDGDQVPTASRPLSAPVAGVSGAASNANAAALAQVSPLLLNLCSFSTILISSHQPY